MKKLNWFVLLLFFPLAVQGQRNADFGISAGVTSYLGDINPNRLLYSPLPAGSLFYRYNFNPRQAIRGGIMVGGLSGNDLDFTNPFQQKRAASFSGFVGEAAIQFEFNFFPYSTEGKLLDYTPYLAGGLGIALDAAAGSGILPVLPFTLGFRINLLKNMGLEAEYGFRKTFYDNFDGLKEFVAPTDYALIHNNDWYSYTGISLTWKIMSKLAGCPAYDDVDSGRKR
ncbi:MAG TPA: DUF6089 family protein [Bacteroidales bacterium]|nr:DUF6089 family protein [Bacteroidales bacterium]